MIIIHDELRAIGNIGVVSSHLESSNSGRYIQWSY